MKFRLLHLLFPLLLAASLASVHAQTPVAGAPSLIDYQGTALDSNGNPLAPTTPINYTMKFRIYPTQSGPGPVWSEQQTVTVSNGQFSVRLGQGIAIGAEARPSLDMVFAGKDRFLGLTIVIPPQAEAEITPRLAFLTSPFSFVAERAKTADAVLQSTGSSALGTTTIANLTVAGPGRVNGANSIEFGAGVAGKQSDAGKIGYGIFTTGALDIVGAGTTGLNRRIRLFAEGGLQVDGALSLSGNQTIAPPSTLSFGTSTRQVLNLWGTEYGLGVQNNTLYSRAASNFAWFAGGTHSNTENLPGAGGTLLANLNGGGLTVNSGHVNVPSGNVVVGGSNSRFGINHFAYTNVTNTWQLGTNDNYVLYAQKTDANRLFSVDSNGFVEAFGGMTLHSPSQLNVNYSGYSNTTINFQARPGDVHIMYLRNSAGADQFAFQNNGLAFKPGGGSWGSISDARLKKDVEDLEGALTKLLKLRSVTFDFKDPKNGSGRQTGFIAQDVEKVFPEWVTENSDKYKMLSISGFESLAVQALRELRAEKDRQLATRDAEIAALKKQLAEIRELGQGQEQRIARLERMFVPASSAATAETSPSAPSPEQIVLAAPVVLKAQTKGPPEAK